VGDPAEDGADDGEWLAGVEEAEAAAQEPDGKDGVVGRRRGGGSGAAADRRKDGVVGRRRGGGSGDAGARRKDGDRAETVARMWNTKRRENPWLYAPTGADRKIGGRLRYLLEAATVASDGLFTHARPFTVPAGLSLKEEVRQVLKVLLQRR
jgi:hypothetical protein